MLTIEIMKQTEHVTVKHMSWKTDISFFEQEYLDSIQMNV